MYSHKDAIQWELGLVWLQEVHQEANSPRHALKQAVDAGDGVGARLELVAEEELCKPSGRKDDVVKANQGQRCRRRHRFKY